MDENSKKIIKKLIDKRKIIVIFSIVFLSLFFISAIIYEHKYSAKNLLKQNISEIQQTLYYYNDENIEISVLSGKRENPYSLDGKSNKLTPYLIIMINQKTFKPISNAFIFINEEKYDFSPTLNPFNNNYVHDLSKEFNNIDKIEIQIDKDDKIYSLENVTNDFKINYLDCIDIINNKFNKLLKTFKNRKQYNAEVFIRIVKVENFDRFFYQFYLVAQNHNAFDFYIDPISKEVYTN